MFYLGLALQAAGRHEEAWPSLRSSLSRETSPARRALLEASLGEVYETREDPFSALLSYARAMRSDPKIFGRDVLILRVEELAKTIAAHRLRTAAERFAGSPAGPYLQAALSSREEQERRSQAARDDAPAQSTAGEASAPSPLSSGRVGIMLPLSGPAGGAGGRVYQGVQLALRHSLAKYPGLRIQLAVRDTKSAAQSAGDAAEVAAELITQEKALALIGPLLTEAAESAAEAANRLKTPMLTPFALRMRMNPDFTWVFRNALTNRLQAQGVAAYAVQHLGCGASPSSGDAALRRHVSGGSRRDRTDRRIHAGGGEPGRRGRQNRFVSGKRHRLQGADARARRHGNDRQLNRLKRSLGLGKSDPYQLSLNFEALFDCPSTTRWRSSSRRRSSSTT